MTGRIVSLDDALALDVRVVGRKAASLACARRAGLPVLPGFVVPITESRPATAAGERALAERNSGYARAVITGQALDPALASAAVAAATAIGDRLVVRSSSAAEADGAWAGAFASYAELAPDEVAVGIKGCWSSIFAPDALERSRAAAVAPSDVGMAVLVQRELAPEFGGVATAAASGEVTVIGTDGPPASIVSGWERGHVAVVGADGGTDRPGLLGERRLRAVADLARRAAEAVGGHIEWAEAEGALWLLQAQSPPAHRSAAPGPGPRLMPDPRWAGVAELLARYPGPIGAAMVLPWAAGRATLPAPSPPSGDPDPATMLARILELRDRLAGEATDVITSLSGPDAGDELDRLEARTPAPDEDAAALLGLLHHLARHFVDSGRIARAAELWHLTERGLRSLVSGELERADAAGRVAMGPGELLLYRIGWSIGTPIEGEAAAPGWCAGPVRLIRNSGDAARFRPREVVAAVYPLNNLAPLLWEASGLVTAGGSPGAHLFEVAAWLGVPAVCGVDLASPFGGSLDALRDAPWAAAAIDADAGRVSVLGAT